MQSLFRPPGSRIPTPTLDSQSGLIDFLSYAMLNRPQVEAAYYDWLAAVERITVERSLPDPRLMFSTDIREMVMALMPGLMMEIPGPGKLGAKARVASAEAEARYHAFAGEVLRAAFEVKREYYSIHFLTERIRVNRESLALVGDLEKLARAQYQVDKVTFQDVLRAQIEQDRLLTEVANLEDSRHPLVARWKGALGIHADQPDPPVPQRFESTPLEATAEGFYAQALARNPQLRAMEAEVRQAEAAVVLARRSRVPDLELGVEVDVKTSPYMVRSRAGMSLPIWRDKIAAEIAAAQSAKRSAQARLTGEQINLAVMLAERLFDFRESTRNLELLVQRLLPKARQSLEVARTGYLSGKVDFFNLIDAERTLLDFQLAEIEALTRREVVAAELSLLLLGTPPSGAPLLPESQSNRSESAPPGPAQSRSRP